VDRIEDCQVGGGLDGCLILKQKEEEEEEEIEREWTGGVMVSLVCSVIHPLAGWLVPGSAGQQQAKLERYRDGGAFICLSEL